ncbi:beta galactosidase jelly roll domain-containing protein [Saccharothrix sp. NRRL B-16348]|uniref:beta galactosidase jelly roll domain-containing protein n=1 Tax=Saccharothrix sp. NRRL B-16348 TaxID=1415542 RepID=UPI001E565FB5|nr:beta galactosidase jelly roll domain-containing protein [Saccharothrix sp. NRRL B-16348]
MTDPVPLLDLAKRSTDWRRHDAVPTLDDLDGAPRLALATTRIDAADPGVLCFGEVRDHASVFVAGRPVGVLLREHHQRALGLHGAVGELAVLVEDHGRVNYGPRIGEPKGLIGGATLDGRPLTGWDVLPLFLDAPPPAWTDRDDDATAVTGAVSGPVLLRARFDLDQPADLHLDTGGWGRGVVWVNGFCLGRYWSRGPQRTLYVPGPVLRAEGNELVVLELAALTEPTARFVPEPLLGHTEA